MVTVTSSTASVRGSLPALTRVQKGRHAGSESLKLGTSPEEGVQRSLDTVHQDPPPDKGKGFCGVPSSYSPFKHLQVPPQSPKGTSGATLSLILTANCSEQSRAGKGKSEPLKVSVPRVLAGLESGSQGPPAESGTGASSTASKAECGLSMPALMTRPNPPVSSLCSPPWPHLQSEVRKLTPRGLKGTHLCFAKEPLDHLQFDDPLKRRSKCLQLGSTLY